MIGDVKLYVVLTSGENTSIGITTYVHVCTFVHLGFESIV